MVGNSQSFEFRNQDPFKDLTFGLLEQHFLGLAEGYLEKAETTKDLGLRDRLIESANSVLDRAKMCEERGQRSEIPTRAEVGEDMARLAVQQQ